MSDAITSIPNPEEQASSFQDDGVSCASFEQSAGNPSTEYLLSGKALPTIKRASLFSRLKRRIFKRKNREQPPANAAPKSQLDKAIELRQRLVEEIDLLKGARAQAEAELVLLQLVLPSAATEGGSPWN
ncbi:MAG: hypothetical protein LQ339_007710 [Xanthoria mediterranea]|nr:MAG: hypothetical protein LQ339_007710 [Xanthoria mediterranea]